MKKYVIFCDGACWPNPNGFGGWGALIILDGTEHRQKIKGAEKNTTNNRMELLAAIMSLKALPDEPCEVVLMSDSKYVKNGITAWIHGWKKNGWMTKEFGGRPAAPVKNADLWQELDVIRAKHSVTFKWVPGHSGISGNEQADRLANEARAELVASTTEAIKAVV